jgi:hypothetical protein
MKYLVRVLFGLSVAVNLVLALLLFQRKEVGPADAPNAAERSAQPAETPRARATKSAGETPATSAKTAAKDSPEPSLRTMTAANETWREHMRGTRTERLPFERHIEETFGTWIAGLTIMDDAKRKLRELLVLRHMTRPDVSELLAKKHITDPDLRREAFAEALSPIDAKVAEVLSGSELETYRALMDTGTSFTNVRRIYVPVFSFDGVPIDTNQSIALAKLLQSFDRGVSRPPVPNGPVAAPPSPIIGPDGLSDRARLIVEQSATFLSDAQVRSLRDHLVGSTPPPQTGTPSVRGGRP